MPGSVVMSQIPKKQIEPIWPKRPEVFPELMTEAELIEYLHIPTVSKSKDYRNVIYRLKRYRDLPRIHICGQPLFPREAIQEWIRRNTKEK